MRAVRTNWTKNLRESTAQLWSELKLPAGFFPSSSLGAFADTGNRLKIWLGSEKDHLQEEREASEAFSGHGSGGKTGNPRGPSAQCQVEWVTDKLDYHLLRGQRELSRSLQGLGNKDPPQEGVCLQITTHVLQAGTRLKLPELRSWRWRSGAPISCRLSRLRCLRPDKLLNQDPVKATPKK